MEQWTDEQLVEQVRQGNQDAYRILVNRHKNYIFSLIYRMLKHRETSEDLSQEAFIKLYRFLDGYQGNAKFTTWLYRLTVNLVKDYQRSKGQKINETVLDKVKGWFAKRSEGPEEQAELKEKRYLVQSLLSSMPEKYRLILYLYHYKQMSYQEIATVTNLSLKAVENRLYRGKIMLKEKWLEVNRDE
ncbi:sigma-70 family RNA polymerase sigma factor [Paenibacillus sp. LMG 31456]|uniref:Sigma-70 family RNA polymerase sigma factor n=1 Tax=Paenibacillus foliorum TaxID=2654974 RepID=A0A972GJ01_9BACL|nr:sigma-70 family RNA polymerase sigma factor [Paenibacillus foliorum]NOU91676.1 sigma-70 family RNA polymerase sigma factor [Paenibacillus foliorum]